MPLQAGTRLGAYEILGPIVATAPAALWVRQMVLGPTPEFCLHSQRSLELPAGFRGHEVSLTPVWTGAETE